MLANRILALLRESAGEYYDADDVAAMLGVALHVRQMTDVIDALQQLESAGLITRSRVRAELTQRGWYEDLVEAEPDGRPDAKAPEPKTPCLGPTSSPAPSQVNGQAKGREDMSISTKQEAVLVFIRDRGGVVRDESGLCASVVASGAGIGSASTPLKDLTDAGLIRREVRGKRTFSVELTPLGIDAARKAKGATNGDVSKLSGGDRMGDKPKRKTPAVRRKPGQGRRPRGGATGRRGSGRSRAGGAVRASGGRVDAAPRDVSGRESVQKELDVIRLGLELDPPPDPKGHRVPVRRRRGAA